MEYRDPLESIQQKARGYMTKGIYPRIHVFSRTTMELDRLVRKFGGNYYRHGSGFLWVFSGRKAIKDLIKQVGEAGYLPSVHGFEDKVGGPIVVARRAGQNFTYAQLMFFFMISGMIVPGSTYWNIAFGRGKGDVTEDEEGIRTVRNFGRKLAWLAKKINE